MRHETKYKRLGFEASRTLGSYMDFTNQKPARRQRPLIPGGELIDDLREADRRLYEQLEAVATFGGESIAGPLSSTHGEIQEILSEVYSRIGLADDLFSDLEASEEDREAINAGLSEAKSTIGQMESRWVNQRASYAALEENYRHHRSMVESMFEELKEEQRAGRLARGAAQRIFRNAEARVATQEEAEKNGS